GNDVYGFAADNPLGRDTIDEARGGVDTLDFSATKSNLTVNLGTATAQTVNGNLTLTLSAADTLENVLGGAGADLILGNALNNSLAGDGGNDTLSGGAGNDTLSGGAGNDVFVFAADSALGQDTIDEAQ